MRKRVVIIGNGIAGITCARYVRKLTDYDIIVISSEGKYFFSRTALMYIYMGHMKLEHTQPYENDFWSKNRIELVQDTVTNIHPNDNCISLANGSRRVQYDYLVLATGSQSNKFGWPGQDLPGVQGLYNLQDLASMEQHTKGIRHAAVVGGGLIGIEVAEMLLSRNIGVSFLVRENSFWNLVLPPEESQLINGIIRHHGIDLQLGTELKEIKAGPGAHQAGSMGKVNSIVTSHGQTIDCGFVALTVGVSPNIGFVKNSGIATDRGIVVNEYLQTNYPNIFACGDCAQHGQPLPGRRPVEQVWYTGKMQGHTVAQNIAGKPMVYSPGHWFNSAKFFDLEYQTYGLVPAQKSEGEEWFYWQDAKGQRALRLLWDKESATFKGLNALGIRIRHEVCNQWLNERASVHRVVKELRQANFDPEFFKQYEPAFQAAFSQHLQTV
jgi:NADPH-dependent 2,4-dienoyl-CoA reductase/sulfur reductase-like enzyme